MPMGANATTPDVIHRLEESVNMSGGTAVAAAMREDLNLYDTIRRAQS